MKVLFVQRDPFPKAGNMILSSVLKRESCACDCIISSMEKEPIGAILSANPDIIFFSITSNEYVWMKEVMERVRPRFKGLVICGGPHPTFYPEMLEECDLDAICMGEGEGAITEVVRETKAGRGILKVKNLWVKRNGRIKKNPLRNLVDDLDSLPWMDWELYNRYSFMVGDRSRNIVISRGCPYGCSFCFNKNYNKLYSGKGKLLRQRSVESVIEEIDYIRKRFPHVRHVIFEDDTFNLFDRAWFAKFADEFRNLGLSFGCNIRADLIDSEFVELIKKGNCTSVRVGIESGNERIRNAVLKKKVTDKQIYRTVDLLKKAKITVQTYNVVGIPGETIENAFETYNMNLRIRPENAWCSIMQPYPKTDIYEIAVKKGCIAGKLDFCKLGPSFFLESPMDIKNKNEFEKLQKLFGLGIRLGFPERFMRSLIKLNLKRLYDIIFKVTFGLGTRKMDHVSLVRLVRIGIVSKNFLGSRSMGEDGVSKHFDFVSGTYDKMTTKPIIGGGKKKEIGTIISMLPSLKGKRVLDAGAGSGIYSIIMRDLGADVTPVDISGGMVDVLKRKGFQAVKGDIKNLKLEKKFDYVICAGALEFCSEPERAMKNIRAHLKNNGKVVVLYPKRNLLNILYLLYHRVHGVYIKLFSKGEMHGIVGASGFEIFEEKTPNCLSNVIMCRVK